MLQDRQTWPSASFPQRQGRHEELRHTTCQGREAWDPQSTMIATSLRRWHNRRLLSIHKSTVRDHSFVQEITIPIPKFLVLDPTKIVALHSTRPAELTRLNVFRMPS